MLSFKYYLTFCFCLLLSRPYLLQAQQVYFKTVRETKAMKNNQQRPIIPLHYYTFRFDTGALRSFLRRVPTEQQLIKKSTAPVMGLPLPNRTTGYFRIWESSVMALGLAARFPNLKTYTGQSVADSTATAKLDWTEAGFHAMISYSTGSLVFIDPYAPGMLTTYQSYYRNDVLKPAKDQQADKVLKQ